MSIVSLHLVQEQTAHMLNIYQLSDTTNLQNVSIFFKKLEQDIIDIYVLDDQNGHTVSIVSLHLVHVYHTHAEHLPTGQHYRASKLSVCS